jgi:putative PEP-CTERM system TPR-repeat lipoprotein
VLDLSFLRRPATSVLTLRGVSAILAFVMLTACDSDVSVEQRLSAAQGFMRAGDGRSAVIEFKAVLQQDADNAKARLELGKLYLDLGDSLSAVKELERAERAGLDAERVRILLARASLLGSLADDALGWLDKVSPDFEAGVVALVRARALITSSRFDEAAQIMAVQETQQADKAEFHLVSALLSRAQGDLTQAISSARRATAIAADNSEAWTTLGDFFLLDGAALEAVDAYEKALGAVTYTDDLFGITAHYGSARAWLLLADVDKAKTHVDKMAVRNSKGPIVRYLRGEIAYQKNDLAAVKIYLQEVLGALPFHARSLLVLGSVHTGEGEYVAASEYLRRYVGLRPADVRGRKLLAAVYLKLNQPDAAVQIMASLVSTSGADPQLLSLMGEAAMDRGDFALANQYLERAAELTPDSSALRTRLAGGQFAENDMQGAVENLKLARGLDPSFRKADEMLIVALLRQGDSANAILAAEELAGKYPDDPGPINFIGVAHQQKKDVDTARKHFEKALTLDDRFEPAMLNLAGLELAAENLDGAKVRFEQVLAVAADNIQALSGLVSIAIRQNHNDEAVRVLELIRAVDASAIMARVMLAAGYLEQGQADTALVVIEEARAIDVDAAAVLLMLSDVQLALNQYDDALDTARQVVSAHPKLRNAHVQLARVYLRRKNLAEALKALQQGGSLEPGYMGPVAELAIAIGQDRKALEIARDLFASSPSPSTASLLMRSLISAGSHAEAIAVGRQLVKQDPQSTGAYYLLGAALEADSQLDRAREVYRSVLENHPQSVAALMNLARVDMRENRQQQAQELYQRVLALSPTHVDALLGLATLAHRNSRFAESVSYLERARDAVPRQLAPRIALVSRYLANNALGAARREADATLVLAPDDPSVMLADAKVLLASGQFRESLSQTRRVLELSKDNADAYFHLGLTHSALGDLPNARTALQQALAKRAEFPSAQIALGQVELAAGQPQAALKIGVALQNAMSGSAAGPMLRGDALWRLKREDEAVKAYREARRVAPDNVSVLAKLARSLWSTQRKDEAETLLGQVIAQRPEQMEPSVILGDLYVADGNMQAAIERYEIVNQAEPRNVLVLNKMAWALGEAGQQERAVKMAKLAYELDSDSIDVLDTYGWLLVRQDQMVQGMSLLKQAVSKLRTTGQDAYDNTIRFHLAAAQMRAGQLDEASAGLKQLLSSPVAFPDRDEAAKMVQTISLMR